VVTGEFGNARSFNGTNDRINMDVVRLALQNSTSWTIEYVARSADGSVAPALINHSCQNGWQLRPESTNIVFGIKTDTAGFCDWSVLEVIPAPALGTATHYYAVTWNGSNLKLYRDGVELASRAASGVFRTVVADSTAYVGFDTFSNTYTAGIADEIRVSSVARSVSEILTTATALGLVAPVTETADYRFQDTLASSVGTPPALTDLFGDTTFISDAVSGDFQRVLSFPQGGGLSLSPTSGVMPSAAYTISVAMRFDSTGGFRRIVDFKNATSDTGLYFLNGRLNFFNIITAPAVTLQPFTWAHVVLTRDSAKNVVGYVNGVQQFSFVDASDLAVISANTLRFFRDDNVVSGEHSAGAVARIRLFDGALDASAVAALGSITGMAATDVEVIADGAPTSSGANLVYTAQIRNNGPAPATGVTATDDITNLNLVSVSSSQGSCSGTSRQATCNIGTLGAGAAATMTVTVSTSGAGWGSHAFSATSATVDADPTNNLKVVTFGNREPLAVAGTNRVIPGTALNGTPVTLDGRGSSDPDGDTLTYRWSGPFPEGGGTVTGATPTVTLAFGESRIALVVNDGQADSHASETVITVTDFVLSAAGGATITRGESATYGISVSPQHGVFDRAVTLGCANLPAFATCSFSPAAVTPNGTSATVTLTIRTTLVAAARPRHGTVPVEFGFWLGVPAVGLLLLGRRGRRRRHPLAIALVLLILLVGLAACGGGGGDNLMKPAPPSPSLHTITVTGTSGALTHSTSVTLSVK
jgi:uncharacterized repeat protein (TIGR01451 family)